MRCFGVVVAPSKPVSTPIPQAPGIPLICWQLSEYSNALVVAFKELPTDKWVNYPVNLNSSQGERVWHAVEPMLAEIKPRLKEMSISNLVGSFKLVPYPGGN